MAGVCCYAVITHPAEAAMLLWENHRMLIHHLWRLLSCTLV